MAFLPSKVTEVCTKEIRGPNGNFLFLVYLLASVRDFASAFGLKFSIFFFIFIFIFFFHKMRKRRCAWESSCHGCEIERKNELLMRRAKFKETIYVEQTEAK